jgi:thiamine pyrophosphokinase
MRHAVVVGSAPVEPDHLRQLCRDAQWVICADGGAAAALDAGIVPTKVVGDFDSLSPERQQHLARLAVQIDLHPPQKDQTDAELALEVALAQQPEAITLTGVLGGRRSDHAVGNLLLLTLGTLRHVHVTLDEERVEAFVVWKERRFAGRPMEYVSLLPISDVVEDIHTEGLRYALQGESLLRGHTRGVSNELAAPTARIATGAGCLLVIHERLTAAAR